MSARTVVHLVLCALSLLTAPLAATAQQAGGTVTIGYLGNASPALEADLVDAFREGLRQLGYVEGHNLVIKYQWAEGQQERHGVLAQELVRLQPDVILTAGTPAPSRPSTRPSPSLSSPQSLGTRWRPASWRASCSPVAT